MLFAVAVVLWVTWKAPARAQEGRWAPTPTAEPPPEGELEPSEQAYETALEDALRAHAAGELERARSSMARAHALQPSARTLRGLGVIALAQGQPREAARFLKASLDDPRHPLTPALRQSVQQRLGRCWEQLARVRARLLPEDAELRVDGRPPPPPEADGEYWLEPGEHEIEVSAPQHQTYHFRETLKPVTLTSLHVVLAPEPPAPQAAEPAPEEAEKPLASRREPKHATPAPLQESRDAQRRAQWGLLGTGAALGAAALSTWLTAKVRFSDIEDACRDGCEQDRIRALWAEKKIGPLRRAAMGIAAGGAALMLTAGGLYLHQWQTERKASARLELWGAGVALRVTR